MPCHCICTILFRMKLACEEWNSPARPWLSPRICLLSRSSSSLSPSTVSQPLSPCHSTLSQFMARKSGLLVHSTGWKEITCEAMARPLSGRHPTVYSEADGKCTARDRSVPHPPRPAVHAAPRPPALSYLPPICFRSSVVSSFLSSSLGALQGFPGKTLLTKMCLK